jgi:hypothetical protein
MVVMKFGFAMQHRPFSKGEGIRGMRLLIIVRISENAE